MLSNFSIWEILEIKKFEHSLRYRLACKAAELANGVADEGPLSSKLSKRLKQSNELLELHKIYLAVKDASICAEEVSEFWECEEDKLKEEREDNWRTEVKLATESKNWERITSALVDVLVDISRSTVPVSKSKILSNAVREMRKLNQEVREQVQSKAQAK
jgi:hypothetical protein